MQPQARQPWWRRWFGSRAERAAERFLRKLGYRILVRNFTCAFGELDLIVLDNGVLVFVEVRSTQHATGERPAASVDLAKQRRLTRLATFFLKQRRLLDHAARFDVLTVSWPDGQNTPTIEHFKNAFEAIGDS